MELLTDFVSITISLGAIFGLTFYYSKSKRFLQKKIDKKLLFAGLFFKIFFSLIFCYFFSEMYENGGDTVSYHKDALIVLHHIFDDPMNFFSIYFTNDYTLFTENYNRIIEAPVFWNLTHEFNTVKYTVPFELISFGSFYGCCLWLSFLTYTGMWKLFETLVSLFQQDKKLLSIILFLPSVLFWTGGVLKDTFILSAVCWMVYSSHQLISFSGIKVKYLLIIALAIFIVIQLKPYVLIALLPCLVLWLFAESLKQVHNKLLKLLLLPSFGLTSILCSILLLFALQSNLGVYGEYDQLLEYSSTVRRGFDSIKGNNLAHEIDFDQSETFNLSGTLLSALSVIHRPFAWESWNTLSLIIGMENLVLLLLCLLSLVFLLFDLKSIRLFYKKPFLLFCLCYSFLLASGIGLSVSNFGAIVRFKSAFILFYLVPFIILISSIKRRFAQ